MSVYSPTFSQCASIAPIVLFSGLNREKGGGNIYLQRKNTFLEFYTDEQKRMQRNACSRSFSHDSVLKLARTDSRATTADYSSRPSSPSFSEEESPHSESTQRPPQLERAGSLHSESADRPYYDGAVTPTSEDTYEYNDLPFPEGTIEVEEQSCPLGMYLLPMVTAETPKVIAPTNVKGNEKRKKSDFSKINPPPSDYAGITTLMIRGIPCGFKQEDLLNLVHSAGLGEECDFFYMPRASRSRGNTPSNLGYAFINFTETIHAWTCAFTFNGMRLDPHRSAKTCEIAPADLQGLPSLRKHFRRKAVTRGPDGPLFFNARGNNKKRPAKSQGTL